MFIPPHTSNLLQPLDLVTFSLQKRWEKNIKIEKKFTYQSRQIIEAYESVVRASSQSYIVDAFKRAGVVRDRLRVEKGVLQTQRHKVMKSFASAYVEMLQKKADFEKREKERIKFEIEKKSILSIKNQQISIYDLHAMMKKEGVFN